MSIKSDRWIRHMAKTQGMIDPFAENQVRAGAISYGVSSYGYDMRVAPEFTIFVGKSTYARCGIITNVTPFEPEWEGFVTLEISNTTPLPAKIYANEGIAQVLFFTADEGDECEVSYKDKKGKYQAQQGITLPKL